MNLKLIYFLLIILIFNIFIIKNNKCEDFTNLNTDNCPSNFPYRTRIPGHKKYNYKYCYKKEKCAVGKEVCYGSQWTDKYKTLPSQ